MLVSWFTFTIVTNIKVTLVACISDAYYRCCLAKITGYFIVYGIILLQIFLLKCKLCKFIFQSVYLNFLLFIDSCQTKNVSLLHFDFFLHSLKVNYLWLLCEEGIIVNTWHCPVQNIIHKRVVFEVKYGFLGFNHVRCDTKVNDFNRS